MNSHALLDAIKQMPKVVSKYKYPNEENMNPAFGDLEHSPLCVGEKRIWVLRGDLNLILGIKNVGVEHGNTHIYEKIDPCVRQHINLGDRYGHPSLAIPENGYDGSVYYAGWLYLHHNYIVVLLQSGRFYNPALTTHQIQILETYISAKFMEAYGVNSVDFFDWNEAESEREFKLFINGKPLPSEKIRRTYTPQHLEIKPEVCENNSPCIKFSMQEKKFTLQFFDHSPLVEKKGEPYRSLQP